jgi:hypothetical protein
VSWLTANYKDMLQTRGSRIEEENKIGKSRSFGKFGY